MVFSLELFSIKLTLNYIESSSNETPILALHWINIVCERMVRWTEMQPIQACYYEIFSDNIIKNLKILIQYFVHFTNNSQYTIVNIKYIEQTLLCYFGIINVFMFSQSYYFCIKFFFIRNVIYSTFTMSKIYAFLITFTKIRV